jgi:hypothetical protein
MFPWVADLAPSHEITYLLEGDNTWKGSIIMLSIKLKIPETAIPRSRNGKASNQIIG